MANGNDMNEDLPQHLKDTVPQVDRSMALAASEIKRRAFDGREDIDTVMPEIQSRYPDVDVDELLSLMHIVATEKQRKILNSYSKANTEFLQ